MEKNFYKVVDSMLRNRLDDSEQCISIENRKKIAIYVIKNHFKKWTKDKKYVDDKQEFCKDIKKIIKSINNEWNQIMINISNLNDIEENSINKEEIIENILNSIIINEPKIDEPKVEEEKKIEKKKVEEENEIIIEEIESDTESEKDKEDIINTNKDNKNNTIKYNIIKQIKEINKWKIVDIYKDQITGYLKVRTSRFKNFVMNSIMENVMEQYQKNDKDEKDKEEEVKKIQEQLKIKFDSIQKMDKFEKKILLTIITLRLMGIDQRTETMKVLEKNRKDEIEMIINLGKKGKIEDDNIVSFEFED